MLSTGPNELPLFLEGDEELTALAEEGAGAAQGLAKQLSATRRSHMACWGVVDDSECHGVGSRNTAGDGSVTDNPSTTKASNGGGAVKGKRERDDELLAETDHKNCMGWWEKVLGRWHQRTQLVDPSLQRKFKVVNQGPWAQVTASLADRERANRKMFMAASEVRALYSTSYLFVSHTLIPINPTPSSG